MPTSSDDAAILHPGQARERFTIERFAPSDRVARFVDHYWFVRWHLEADETHAQRVLSHPVVNVSVGPDGARLVGPTTAVVERQLVGTGWTVGIMFRPAGFWPMLRQPLVTLAHRELPLDGVLADGAASRIRDAAEQVLEHDDQADALEAVLSQMLPNARQTSEATTTLAELAREDRAIIRVEELAAAAGVSVRTLQRNFRAHVGLGPKDVIRRYRLHEVALRAATHNVEWPALAAELGYADQSHLIRDFRAVVGETPAGYRLKT